MQKKTPLFVEWGALQSLQLWGLAKHARFGRGSRKVDGTRDKSRR